MRMMKVVRYQIIHMISVRNGLMSAAGSMTVVPTVGIAGMVRRAGGRIPTAHVQSMVVHVVSVRLMQMTVVQVVHVPVVFDCGMATTGVVRVGVSFMNLVIFRHFYRSLPRCITRAGM